MLIDNFIFFWLQFNEHKLLVLLLLCVSVQMRSMSVNGNNGSEVSRQDDIKNFNDVNDPQLMGGISVIHLPLTEGRSVPHHEYYVSTVATKRTF